MSNRATYGVQILTETLQNIAERLDTDLNIYLIGGGAMMFHGLKNSTKDIDIVFSSKKDTQRFIDAALLTGIKHRDDPGEVYEKMGTSAVMVADSGIQLDLFSRVVCNALELTESIVVRTVHHRDMGRLQVYLMSREDIALFKSITEREVDLEDIRILNDAGIDWDVVEEECLNQRDSGVWANLVLDKVSDLYDRYGINLKLNRIKEHADSYVLLSSFKIIMSEEEVRFKDIYRVVKEKTDYSESWTRKSLRKLEQEGLVASRKKGRDRLYRLIDE